MTHVLGEGQVKLELSSRNFLVLNGVYHIFYIRKKFNKYSFVRVVFESNRVVITKHVVFIGKGYICDGLFLLMKLVFLLLLQMLNVLICGMLDLNM